nr:hydrogenase iron-sulfur subunit [Anaerolineae bacterium]
AAAMNPIIVFTCNWGAYAGVEAAGRAGLEYPPQVRLVRLMCAGRVHPGMLLHAFERGAAGVLVVACADGECHYERGNEQAAVAVAKATELGRLLGINAARLRLAHVPLGDGEAFVQVVREFVEGLGEG